MTILLNSNKYLSNAHQGMAEHQTLSSVLNCYLREFALPARQVEWRATGDLPKALTSGVLPGETVRLTLPGVSAKLALKADRVSLLGRCRFTSPPFVKAFGKPWRPLDCLATCKLLIEDMTRQTQTGYNRELEEQIINSIRVTQAFLNQRPFSQDDPLLESEQSLLWGHPMHPSPKSRHGVPMDELLACSPEVGARFPLHWFRVDSRLLRHQGEIEALATLEHMTGLSDLYPCHPWEVGQILGSPLYQKAAQSGLIEHLGPQGRRLWPTSSVRTLYHPELPYFLKCSIHVRLTNCIRKNAWYELESAVFMSRHLAPALAELERRNPGFSLLREPAATTLDFSSLEGGEKTAAVRHLQECFGILYRHNLHPQTRQENRVTLAGALFAWDQLGQSTIAKRLSRLARKRGISYRSMALQWFKAYVSVLVPGILDACFNHGIVFEPHLQNTLIGFKDELPSQVWIRDLEGTKLLPDYWPAEQLGELSETARASVYYNREQGWKRIGYCLLVNNLSEAIFHVSDGNPELEHQAWQQLAATLSHWARTNDEPEELSQLLAGAPLPAKNNLKTRLHRQADRLADYTLISHPMRQHP